jgi:hypothetical protein
MNLEDLKNIKIDMNALKNISMADVRNFINEQQVLALNIAIALGAVIVGLILLHIRLEEYGKLKRQLNSLVVKEEPARKYDKSLKKTRDFLKTLHPSLAEEDVIPYLTQFADRHHVVISELRPPQTRVEAFYREVNILMVCSMASFHEALMFFNDLENSEFLFKINSLSMSPQQNAKSLDDPRLKSQLTVSLDISSIQLMENDNKKQKNK